MKSALDELVDLCKSINDNWHNNENADGWKNLRLVPEAANKLQAMPLEGETSAANQIEVLDLMLECVDELSIPRQALGIRKYQLSLYDKVAEGEEVKVERSSVEEEIKRLEEYIDLSIPTEEWRKRYHKMLKFDPVERTLEWEVNIYDAEEEAHKHLGDTPRGMGFCFEYWAELRNAMAQRGIEWKSPHIMNPHVMFD